MLAADAPPRHATATGPTVQEVVGASGVRAYLVTDTTLPFLSMAFQWEAGAAQDGPGKDGLASMVAGLLNEGAGDLDSEGFQRQLEDNAIRLVFDADRDSLSGSLRTLNETRALAFDLLRQAVTKPRFDAEPVERTRGQMIADLRRKETNPNYLASRTWFEQAFGEHPYGRPSAGRVETIEAMGRADLAGFVGRGLDRAGLSIGVSGDIEAGELAGLLDLAFGDLPLHHELPAVPEAVPLVGQTIIVERPLPQSVVTFGRAGIDRQDPDWYAAYIVNYVLGGGGFSSRLMQEVREARGLAYGVGSQLYDAHHSPLWLGGVATKNEEVATSMSVIRAEVLRLAGGDLGETELGDAKTYLTGSFPLRLTSNDQLARMLLGMMARGLGRDFIARRNGLIEAVTLDDARRVAARLLSGEMLVSVVGRPVGLAS